MQIRWLLIASLFAEGSTRFLCDNAALFENPPVRQLFVSVFSRVLLSSDARDGEGGVDCVFLFFSVFFYVFSHKKRFFLEKKRYRRLVFLGKTVCS